MKKLLFILPLFAFLALPANAQDKLKTKRFEVGLDAFSIGYNSNVSKTSDQRYEKINALSGIMARYHFSKVSLRLGAHYRRFENDYITEGKLTAFSLGVQTHLFKKLKWFYTFSDLRYIDVVRKYNYVPYCGWDFSGLELNNTLSLFTGLGASVTFFRTLVLSSEFAVETGATYFGGKKIFVYQPEARQDYYFAFAPSLRFMLSAKF